MAFVMPGLQKVTGEIGSWFGQKKKEPVIQEGDISGPTVGKGPTGIALPSGKDIFGSTPLIAEDFLKPVQVQNPYEEQLKAALGQSMAPDFTRAQQTAGGQASFAEALRGLYGTGASGLSGLIGTLQRQQAGDFGPGGSLAQKILEQGLGQNIAGVRSQLASQRGLSPALAARYAAQQTAQLGGQTAQQAGILGLQQQLGAQQLLGQLTGQAATLGSKGADVLGQMRGQDIAQATATSDAALKRLGILASSDTGIRQLQAQTGMSENEIRMKIKAANQAAAAGDRQMAASILGGVLGGASQGAAAVATKGLMAYDGGRIKGEAPVAGDHPKNDIVPANLSPGEIVIPRSAAGSKKAAKSFIDSLDDWDEEPSYSKVLKARSQKKNYAEGGVVEPDMEKEILDMSRRKYLEKGFDAPIPGVAPMKQSLDEMLSRGVVEPMAKAGYPTLGAAMATVPSTLAEALIPSTAADLAGTLLPLPGAKLGRGAAKQIKETKAAQLLEQMAADDVDISKLPSLSEFKKISKEYEKQKVKQEGEKLRSKTMDLIHESAQTAKNAVQDIFENPSPAAKQNIGFSTDILENLAQDNLNNKKIAKAWDEYQKMAMAKTEAMRFLQTNETKPLSNMNVRNIFNAFEQSKINLYQTLKDNKKDLKLTDEMEKLKKVRQFPRYFFEGPPPEKRTTESKKFWDKNKKDED